LAIAPEAVRIDTTGLSVDEVFDRVMDLIRGVLQDRASGT
jgi:cytidylate kinase